MALTRSMGARKDATRGTAPMEVRKATAAQYIRAGVLPGGATPLVTGTSSTSGMTYSVGAAGFVSSLGVADGFHLFTNDGAVTIGTTGVGSTIPAAPGTGLSRIDIIWVRQGSASENADTSSQPMFGVASGVAHSSPQPPTIPAGALELARNVMSGGVTSTAASGNSITQTAPYTGVRGAIVPVRNLTERNLLGGLSTTANPILADRMDIGLIERGNSDGWTSLTGSASGSIPVPAFILGSSTPAVPLLPASPISHPLSGPVVVEATLSGDLVIGGNSSAKLILTVGGVSRIGWVQNFAAGNLRDSPSVTVRAAVARGGIVQPTVSVSDVGVGGVSGEAGSLQIDWTVRPA